MSAGLVDGAALAAPFLGWVLHWDLVLAGGCGGAAAATRGALLRHDLVKGEERCELTAAELAKFRTHVQQAFAVPSELPMHKGKSALQSFGVILRRMRHQKMSSLLVPLAGEAAKSGDASLFGALLDLEGASLRMYASLP